MASILPFVRNKLDFDDEVTRPHGRGVRRGAEVRRVTALGRDDGSFLAAVRRPLRTGELVQGPTRPPANAHQMGSTIRNQRANE
jgi:hypothetical protein